MRNTQKTNHLKIFITISIITTRYQKLKSKKIRKISEKIKKTEKINDSEKKEKENLLDRKKPVLQNQIPDIHNQENPPNSNWSKQVNYEETCIGNYTSFEEIDNKYGINNRIRKRSEIGEEKEEMEVKIGKEKEGDNSWKHTEIREDHLILKI